jgi:hypothetical protein
MAKKNEQAKDAKVGRQRSANFPAPHCRGLPIRPGKRQGPFRVAADGRPHYRLPHESQSAG